MPMSGHCPTPSEDLVNIEVGDNSRSLCDNDQAASIDPLHAFVLDDQPSAQRLGSPGGAVRNPQDERRRPLFKRGWWNVRSRGVVLVFRSRRRPGLPATLFRGEPDDLASEG